MKKTILKATSLLMPMSFVCWYVDEPGAAVAVFIVSFIACLELIQTKKQY